MFRKERIHMRKFTLLFVAALSVSMAAYATENAAASSVSLPVKQAWIDIANKDAQEAGRPVNEQMIRQNLINSQLLAREAMRIGIDKRPEFAAREELARQELLANLMIRDYLDKNPVTEDMLKEAYKEFKARLGNKEYNARVIQVQAEDEAKDIIAQLAKGADFDKLAKDKSTDAVTGKNGGLLGWVAKGLLKPALAEALSRLQVGLYTTVPIQTDAGWHILKLEGIRDFKAPAYDKVKEQLRQRLKAQQVVKLLDSLRTQAKMEQTR